MTNKSDEEINTEIDKMVNEVSLYANDYQYKYFRVQNGWEGVAKIIWGELEMVE